MHPLCETMELEGIKKSWLGFEPRCFHFFMPFFLRQHPGTEDIREQILRLLPDLFQRRIFHMALINKPEYPETDETRYLFRRILQFQPSPDMIRMEFHCLQDNTVKSGCQIWIFLRICVPEEIIPFVIDPEDAVQHIHISRYQMSPRIILLLPPVIVLCPGLPPLFCTVP